MTQGLYSAVSGIRSNQTRMDVISNNIANVNTLGFKSSSVNFANVFAKTITGGTSPNGTLGGTNPMQVGNGSYVSEIASNFSQGGTQFTGRSTDVMIQGEGFVAVERIDVNNANASTDFYLTRAGNFTLDSNGNLVSAAGNRIRGTSDLNGTATNTLGRIQVPLEFQIAKAVDVNGNVLAVRYGDNASTTGGGAGALDNVADAQALVTGRGYVAPTDVVASVGVVTAELRTFSVGADGSITATYSNGDRISVRTESGTTNREIIHLPYEGGSFGHTSTFAGTPSDGGPVDQLAGNPVFTGGTTPDVTTVGGDPMQGMQLQIQMATVTNPAGLIYDGGNNFLISANSGSADFGVAGTGSKGSLLAGALESSNVDIAGEFTNMILTQRGIEAASRVIRAQSEILQNIINNTV